MTTCVLRFAVPPERLEYDVSAYMNKDVGPTWPQESCKVILNDLKPEPQSPEHAEPLMDQLDSSGFAVLKNKSQTLGELQFQEEWNAAYLEETAQMIREQLGADEVYVWNSVSRSADPAINTAYGNDHLQHKAIKGLQFGTTVRPVASGVHVDQDGPNSRRMCRGAAGEDVFDRFARVQQLNVWRPLKGPVTCKPLAVCDGRTVSDKAKNVHMGLFGTRVVVHYDENQKWYYIKRQQPDEVFILKIFDSHVLPGGAEFTPHTGVDELNGADGPETPRQSIEVRLVACYH
ncbi:hypothetical protein K504DRAFT_506403 [Pleomassaria siparia CBS 279.74]|uniref:CmcJ-like methyltransferase n=1 Tax=Pleomassaria siparia CBS 279.74 TaxID=1314801 RepID=A0A6G1JWE1_9PLEO|nr:hypothetical protein K504DRAFT_506403 [Pleomassaria siparia CBS 279.74]